MLWSGLSAVIGSWNTMPMARPRTSHIAASDLRHQVVALEQDPTLRLRPARQADP